MNKIQEHVIQFSPIRSGSTLVYNILKELFNSVSKQHNYGFTQNEKVVVTIRHPYNSIISSILRLNEEINDETLKKHTEDYLKNGGKDVLDLDENQQNICLLKYENFNKNYDYIFSELENKFLISIDTEVKNKINTNLSIENVIKLSQSFNDFSEYDINTHIHGNHISKNRGNTNFNSILTENQISKLEENITLNKILKKFNY